ncbi:MAG TPA: hypothetical protein O0X39_05355 [Methanocorpusculum sp.]|nr:hypothetical protein [Methanocorpusculum sp.]
MEKICASHPDDAKLSAFYLESLRYDAARVFPLQINSDWNVICDEVGIEPPVSEEEKTELEKENDNLKRESGYAVTRWSITIDDNWYLEQHLVEIEATAELIYNLHKDHLGIPERYADLLSHCVFSLWFEEIADKQDCIQDGQVKRELDKLSALYTEHPSETVAYRYLEALTFSMIDADLCACDRNEWLARVEKRRSRIEQIYHNHETVSNPELKGMYLRALAALASHFVFMEKQHDFCEYTPAGNIIRELSNPYTLKGKEKNWCKKLAEEIIDFFHEQSTRAEENEQAECVNATIACAEIFANYLIPTGSIKEREANILFDEISDELYDAETGDYDKDGGILAKVRIYNAYIKKGWTIPEDASIFRLKTIPYIFLLTENDISQIRFKDGARYHVLKEI